MNPSPTYHILHLPNNGLQRTAHTRREDWCLAAVSPPAV
jgi:hypothetical protein